MSQFGPPVRSNQRRRDRLAEWSVLYLMVSNGRLRRGSRVCAIIAAISAAADCSRVE
jgi:hypothetical protein